MELTKIADWLLLNGTLTKCPGLLHGKLGIAIFFFHYARYTGKTLFEEYAWDLIMAIQEQLHVNYRPDYEKGIAGIGEGSTIYPTIILLRLRKIYLRISISGCTEPSFTTLSLITVVMKD